PPPVPRRASRRGAGTGKDPREPGNHGAIPVASQAHPAPRHTGDRPPAHPTLTSPADDTAHPDAPTAPPASVTADPRTAAAPRSTRGGTRHPAPGAASRWRSRPGPAPTPRP